MNGMDDPRVHKFRSARAAVDMGLRAPAGAAERYRKAIGPYLEFMAELTPAESEIARRHMMAQLAYATKLPLGAIAIAFRATEAEMAWVREQEPAFREEPVDEQARLAALPYGVYLKTPHWYAVRKATLEYYGGRCAICNTHASPLEVHHRNYDRRGAERPADVIALCADCHKRHHGKLRVA